MENSKINRQFEICRASELDIIPKYLENHLCGIIEEYGKTKAILMSSNGNKVFTVVLKEKD